MDVEEQKAQTSYGTIFKTTFLFGFVQLFRVSIGVISNKIAALLIGAEGMGILGVYNSTINMIQTGAGLGVNQSAVRDIAEANGAKERNRFSRIICITNKVILFTGLLGCIITLFLSYWLSSWTFGDSMHMIAYCVLSIAVGLNIINESKQAILKGMRQLKSLAKASMIGSVSGLLVSAPLYLFFGKEAIIPVILIASIVAVLVSNHFVNKIEYDHLDVSFKESLKGSKTMIKMGLALMSMTFLQTIVAFIINTYIRKLGGFTDVGYYVAGTTITSSYFGIIVSALMTDYYPRIAAVNKDNKALEMELNKQSIVSLILCCPLFVLFMGLLPIFISLLYTQEFLPAVDFVKWSMYWTIITVCSNQVDLILVAKFETKVFLVISVIFRVIQVVLCTQLYRLYGLEGLGIAYFILGVLHVTIMCTTVYHFYRIKFNRSFLKIALVSLVFIVLSTLSQQLLTNYWFYCAIASLFISSLYFSYYTTNKVLNMNIIILINNRFKKIERNETTS